MVSCILALKGHICFEVGCKHGKWINLWLQAESTMKHVVSYGVHFVCMQENGIKPEYGLTETGILQASEAGLVVALLHVDINPLLCTATVS